MCVCLCIYVDICIFLMYRVHSPVLAASETKKKTSYTGRNISTAIGDK